MKHNTHQGFHRDRHGSFEVLWADAGEWLEGDDCTPCQAGWYWQAGSPGCLPDGDTSGPFTTSTEAYEDARGFDQ